MIVRRIARALLRWERIVALAAILLPLAAAAGLGFIWLAENGWLILFLATSAGLGLLVALLRLLVRALNRRARTTSELSVFDGVEVDPEWNTGERDAFLAAVKLIHDRLDTPVAGPELQALGIEVVETVAGALGRKQALDFTLPEALLLVERVTARFRGHIRQMVPFADTLSLATLWLVWKHRARVQRAVSLGQGAWRFARVLRNPPAALVREIDAAIAGGHSSFLGQEAMAVGQAILLEEVASAAVDLFSGRLKFSDSELLELSLARGDADRDRLAQPDTPLRIAVGGQVSVGKSSLINALLGEERAEIDVPPTTDRAATYGTEIDGMACMLLDLPGLDGSARVRDAVLAELMAADIVLWVTRASRPAREVDRATLAEWQHRFAALPTRRMPPVIAVATDIDTLCDGWPFPEHILPPAASETIARAVTAIAEDIGTDIPIPVSLVAPDWNLDEVRGRLISRLGEGLMVQRNHARLSDSGGFSREASRAASGVRGGIGRFGKGLMGRWRGG